MGEVYTNCKEFKIPQVVVKKKKRLLNKPIQILELPKITLFTGLSPIESIIISILLPTATNPEFDKVSRRLLIYSTLDPFMTRVAILNRINYLQKNKYISAFLIPLFDPSTLSRAMPTKNIQTKAGRPFNS